MGLKAGSRSLKQQMLQLIFVSVFLTSHFCHAISRQTEAAMRDFSKLRLEKRVLVRPKIPILYPFTENKLHENSLNEESVSATEFKPSYADSTNFNNHPYPPHSSGNTRGNNSPEDYLDPGQGGFYPPTTQQNPNFHRPLLGGPGPTGSDDDNSSVGMGIGPAGYGTGNKNPHQKPEVSSNPDTPSEDGDDGQEPYLNQESPSEIENGGEGYGKGYGGLFDSDTESSTEDQSDQDPESPYYRESGPEGEGHGAHNPRHHPHEGPYDPSESTDDGVRGYSTPGGGGGLRGSSNRDDYADY